LQVLHYPVSSPDVKQFAKSNAGMNRLFLLLVLIVYAIPGLRAQGIAGADTLKTSGDSVSTELNEVVITATRVPQRIIDIPYSVIRIKYSTFQYDRKIGSNDMLSGVPGLFLQSRYGDHDVRFSIRGFGSRSNSGVRGIRILLDDIPESEPDGQTRLEALDFNTINRIEIVKGNASSLYTNAPGGVVNFFNNLDFTKSFIAQYNNFGSFGLRKNGIQAGIRTEKYGMLASYSYVNYDGYRAHNTENWNIANVLVETTPSANTSLKILGYFVDGMIRLPGSLTKAEFEADPWQASKRSVDRDEKRITTKGRVGIRYDASFGSKLNNEIEITAFGTIKYFHRTAKDYRIINRYGFGFSARYINKATVGKYRHNEFSVGTDLYMQPARTEYYQNIGGKKGDQMEQLVAENIINEGIYFSDNFEILPRKLFLLLTGRFDNVVNKQQEETLPSRSDKLTFAGFTPKLALNYKITGNISLYGSYGKSFDSPALNEMDSPEPSFLYNQDIRPQQSDNFELGIKGNLVKPDAARVLRKFLFEATAFYVNVTDEIVPFEVNGNVYYRNAAKTNRLGLELGAQLEIVKNLNFMGSYTYSFFKYVTYEARSLSVDTSGNVIETNRDFGGNYAPSIPVNNVFLALSYSYPVTRGISLFAKVSYQGISGMWVDDANSDKTSAYNLLNSVVGIDLKIWKFNFLLSGGVNNLTNEIYVGFTNTNSADGRYYEAGAPRDFFCTCNIGFTF